VAKPPRLIDWTGERCVPWGDEIQGTYEHLHRYYFAAEFAEGRRVLDLASGEGYGAAILAERARHVVGVEIDAQTVAHSRAAYDLPNLEFAHGSMLDLEAYEDGEFGLVTCFEAIEHIAEQAELVAAVARVLVPDGIFLVSTPDRDAYNAALPEPNPFHVHELDRSEFLELLAPHFPHVSLWGQTGVGGSRLGAVDRPVTRPTASTEQLVLRQDGSWGEARTAPPTFFVAAASREPLPPAATHSYLLDPSLQALRERDKRVSIRDAVARELAAQVDRLRGEVETVRVRGVEPDSETSAGPSTTGLGRVWARLSRLARRS
jgi:SAM-dependent methyltransferase